LASLAAFGCLPTPVVWSPDGRWLAYTVAVRPELRLLKPGWLFDTKPEPQDELLGWGNASSRPQARLHRLWATRADTGVSVLLEESARPLTSPVWSPDGKSMAFGRLVDEGDGKARFEIVVQDAPDRKHVLVKQPAAAINDRALDLPALSLAWSPDGRYLAVPVFHQSLGLQIVRADTGRMLKEISDAYFPSWSPDSTKLAFVRGTDRQSLHCLDTNYGESNHADDIGHVVQAPVWSRDRRSVMVVVRRKGRQTIDRVGMVSVLIRMPVERGQVQPIPLPADLPDRDRPDLGASFSFDPDGDVLVYSMDAENQLSIVATFLPGGGVTSKKDNPVDFTIRVSALSVSPAGRTLAFRGGGPHSFAPPGLWDLTTNRFTPVVPDDSVRVQWITTLVAAARRLLREGVSPPLDDDGRAIERPTPLPIPGELAENNPTMARLKRLGRYGTALCDRPSTWAKPEPEVADLLEEARLFFAYLRGDFSAALAALETLESRTTNADHRLRLLSLRAQIYIGKRQDERAEWTIEFLQSLQRTPPRRLELTPAGHKLTEEAGPGDEWPRYLAARSREYFKENPDSLERPFGRHGLESILPPHVEPPRFGALPEAPGNFLELRQDDVPVLIGNGGAMRGEVRELPPRVDPMPRRVPRRQGFNREPR